MGKSLVEMAAEIIQSQASSTTMTTEEVTIALQSTFKTLQDLQQSEMQLSNEDAVQGKTFAELAPEKSIQKNKVICLECGQEFKMLSPKHLASHDLTAREYRQKYGLKLRQPLCAKSLSASRKKAGKARGIPDNLKKAIEEKKKKKSTSKTSAKKTAPKNKKTTK